MRTLMDNGLTRDAIVEGVFYPAEPEAMVEEMEELVRPFFAENHTPRPIALFLPHASWTYAGRLLGKAFAKVAQFKGLFSRVAMWSRVHREPQSALFLPESSFFATPIGELSLDREAYSAMHNLTGFFRTDEFAHLEEHALEVAFPFVARYVPDARVLPVLAGDTSCDLMRELGRGLSAAYGGRWKDVLFIISSNLSTFEEPIDGSRTADTFVEQVLSYNIDELIEAACRDGASHSLRLLLPFLLFARIEDIQLHFNLLGRDSSPVEFGKCVQYGAFLISGGTYDATYG
ncbi:AmmeMemoRadiSam system protein B [Spirochaetia bacterium 38H-sp]|uniref:AmmeMemoRadiSam system protein B n=1 Tax=Rarispira pelagica TaxID=3141764 RepID=A0ABU9U8C6_9SPIR